MRKSIIYNSIIGNEDADVTDLNSIADLAKWINDHGDKADGMVTAIEGNTAAIELINKTTIPAAIEEAKGYTDDAIEELDLDNTYEAKGTADAAIAALKLSDTYEAKGTANAAIEALKLADTYEAKGTAASAIEALKLSETYEAKGTAAAAIEALKLSETYEAKGTAANLLEDYKVKDVDTSLALDENGVASVKAVSTDLLFQGAEEIIFCAGGAGVKAAE